MQRQWPWQVNDSGNSSGSDLLWQSKWQWSVTRTATYPPPPPTSHRYYKTTDTMRWAGKAWSAEFDAAKIVRHRHPVYERVRALLEALFPKEHLWLDRASANSCEYGAIHFREYT